MACPPERYANLPIAPQYKESLVAFCSDPNNAGACEQLCKASDEEIIATVEQIGPQLDKWQKEGIPDEIRNGIPEFANEVPQGPNVAEGMAEQGIGSLPSKVDPAIPPGQLANVPMPMDVPSPPPNASNVSYRNGGFVNAPSFGLGGFVKDMFGGNGGLLGGIIGGALAFYTGGMSIAAGAALGSAAGTYADTKDLGLAARAGAGVYGMGVAGAGIAGGTAAGTVKGMATIGKNVVAAGQKPEQPRQPIMAPMPNGPNPHDERQSARIPGSNFKPIANPHLDQGLGALPSMAVSAFGDTPGQIPAVPQIPMAQQTPSASLNTTLSPMDEYYQCVAQNGAENCQLPTEMNQQANPATIQPAQYAKNFMDGGAVDGPGTETSDSQPAWLSDNEFVMTADAVRGMGNGDIEAGANRMYELMAQLETRGQS